MKLMLILLSSASAGQLFLCKARAAFSILGIGIKDFFAGKPETQGEYQTKMLQVLEKQPANPNISFQALPIFHPENYYRFASYAALSYVREQDIREMSLNTKVSNHSFYLGEFELIVRRAMQGIRGLFKQNDAVYTLTKNPKQKVIVMSIRGSVVMNDFVADLESQNFQRATPAFFDKTRCGFTGDEALMIGKGFMNSMPKSVLDAAIADLSKSTSKFPNYSLVITGHSLGAAKAMLLALHLKLHTKLKVDAVYTYGQPSLGSSSFNDYIALCLGAERIVRIVSSNDIVPWINVGSNQNRHSELIKEVYAPNPKSAEWVICQGSRDTRCSASTSCKNKNWENHSRYGGFELSEGIKLLAVRGTFGRKGIF